MRMFFYQVANSFSEEKIPFCAIFHTADKLNNGQKLNEKNFIAVHEKYYWQVREFVKNTVHKVWRRKIEIWSGDEMVGIYFIKQKKNKVYFYDYVKHKISKQKTVEQQFIIAGKIFSAKSTEKNISIPRSSGFYSKDNLIHNSNYRQITVVIPMLYREEKIIDLVKSLYECSDERMYKIYVGDQSEYTNEFLKNFLTRTGHVYFNIPYDSGLANTRNRLIRKVDSPYIFICDDDTVFDSKCPFSTLESVLLNDKTVGLCAGQFSNRFPYLDLYKQTDYYDYVIDTKNEFITKNDVTYCIADCVTNFFLARTEMLTQIKWHDELKFGEHVPWFLKVRDSHWKVAYTANVQCQHNSKTDNTYYSNHYQNNRMKGYQIFYEKEKIRTTYTRDLRNQEKRKLKYAVIAWDKIEVYEQIKGWSDERYNHYFNYFPQHENIVINLNQHETKNYTFKNFNVYDCKDDLDFLKILKSNNIDFVFTWNCETKKLDSCVSICRKLNLPLIAMPVSTKNLRLSQLARCTLVICISNAVKKICQETCANEILEVVPIGLSPNVFYPLPQKSQNKELVVATLGRGMTSSKNWYNTAKALQLVSKQTPIKWIVAGSKTETIIDFAKNKNYDLMSFATNNLTIDHRGVVNAVEANKIYNESDIFLLASIYEGQGLVWFESWLTHTPVATSNLSPMNTYVKSGINGELFNPNSIYSIYKTILFMKDNLTIYKDYDKSVKGFLVDDVLEKREKIFKRHIKKYFIQKKSIKLPIQTSQEKSITEKMLENYNFIVNELNSKNISFCLLRTTCYDAIKYGYFYTQEKIIYLGIQNIQDSLDEITTKVPHSEITVSFLPWPKKTKVWGKWYHQTRVPYPVLPYLKDIGKDL